MSVLANLEPRGVFEYFEKISSIPRGSGNEKEISDYMVEFAKGLGLEVKQDSVYNVYIKKPATKGYENLPTVIMQGHLDMVCEKNNETEFDFEKQGLDLYIDGDFIRAKGTTLGADNGVAIAYQMAILADSTLEHPALEMLMTTEEETGMGGVEGMQPEYLEGKVLLNLDTDLEGEFLVSCAGGARTKVTIPANYTELNDNDVAFKVTVDGLIGGHSGAEIHHERANANIVMGRVLDALRERMDLSVASISGGSKDNVITRECEAVVVVAEADKSSCLAVVEEVQNILKEEYHTQDPDIRIAVTETEVARKLGGKVTNQLIDALILMPNGIVGMSHSIENLVETSVNIGVVVSTDESITLTSALRSSMPTRKQELINRIKHTSRVIGIECEVGSNYPAWVYAPESKIRELAKKTYQEMYDKEPKISAIHAGLECGFISEKLPGVDMISFGPNVYAIHSPEERVSISSMSRVYGFVTELLKNMKEY